MANFSDFIRQNPQAIAAAQQAYGTSLVAPASAAAEPPAVAPVQLPPAAPAPEQQASAPAQPAQSATPAPAQSEAVPAPAKRQATAAEAARAAESFDAAVSEAGQASSPLVDTRPAEALAPINVYKGSPAQQERKYFADQVAAASEVGQSHLREGEAKANEASESAKLYEDFANRTNRYVEAAEQRYSDALERAKKYEQFADEDFERLRKEPFKPGKTRQLFNVITGIVAGAAGGEIAGAMNALSAHVNQQTEVDAAERVAAKERLKEGREIHDNILDTAANGMDAAAKLSANQWLVASKRLDKLAAETKVPQIREEALRLKIAADNKARDTLRENAAQQVKRAAAAASARQDWSRYSLPELEALEKSGKLPGSGVEYLDGLRKGKLGNAKTSVELAKLEEETRRSAAEGAKGPGGPKTEGERKTDQVVRGALPAYSRLTPMIRDKYGVELKSDKIDMPWYGVNESMLPGIVVPKGHEQFEADTTTLLEAVLRAKSGASITAQDVDIERKALGLESSSEEVRANGLKRLVSAYEALDTQGRIQGQAAPTGDALTRVRPAEEPPTQAGPPAPTTRQAQVPVAKRTIGMIAPTGLAGIAGGSRIEAEPEHVERYKALGFVPASDFDPTRKPGGVENEAEGQSMLAENGR